MDNRPDGSRNYLSGHPLQCVEDDEEEDVLQGKFSAPAQRVESEEDEGVTQRMEDNPNAGKVTSMGENVVQRLDVKKSTNDFRFKHLLAGDGRSYNGYYSPKEVYYLREEEEGSRFQGANSMLTVEEFGKIPDDHGPSINVKAKTWSGIYSSKGLVGFNVSGPSDVRLAFNKYGHACHLDEKIGMSRRKK